MYGERTGIYRVLVEKPEEKRLLGRPSHRWEDNINTDLKEVGCGGMDWIELAQDRDRWLAGLSVLWVAYTTHSTLKPVSTLPR
jgi:hypothetical protein